jgi:thioredoxin 1
MSQIGAHTATAHFTDENFEPEVISSKIPVLVDFWAEWCGPCKTVGPVIEKLAEKFAGKVRIGKLNVDENPATASRFSIRGIPSLLLFREGEVVNQAVGVQSRTEIEALIGQVL